MAFKVIVTHDSEEGDEHTYYAIVFPNRDIGQIKRLKYSSKNDRLEVAFTFASDKVKQGEHFLAVLVPVEESEIRPNTTPQHKIGTNSVANVPEVIYFP